MESQRRDSGLGELPDAVRRLMRAELDLGRSLLRSLLGSVPSSGDGSLAEMLGLGKPKCTIPPPCWMPQNLGDRISHVSSCSTVCMEIEIDNCGLGDHEVKVAVRGDQKNVQISPETLSLRALERGRVKLEVHIPKDAKTGSTSELTVIIAGCKVHYLRWTLSVGTFGLKTDQCVCVKDCADQIHHWYDHFYCPRPCGGVPARPTLSQAGAEVGTPVRAATNA